jgi:imidazolonepropionase-like amidohydrolase
MAERKIVKCGAVIDGVSSDVRSDVLVEIIDGRFAMLMPVDDDILANEPDFLDLSEYTVLPGLVDAHDHLGFDIGDIQAQAGEGPASLTLRAVRNAAQMLSSGITTVRDLGEVNNLGVLWRDAVDRGEFFGPRMVVAREWITRTGGHAWFAAREADGEVDVRKAVREQVRGGADWVKIMVSGGVMTPGSMPVAPGLSNPEIRAAIDEAHMLGRPVSGHAIGGQGLTDSVNAGIDTIEHAYFATDEDLEIMASAGIDFVSTFSIVHAGATDARLSEEIRDKFRRVYDACLESLSRARDLGIRIGAGCDLQHASLSVEAVGLTHAGFSAMEVVQILTRVNAAICRVDDVGTIESGKAADFIAIEGNPVVDLAKLRNVRLVARDGVLLVDNRHPHSHSDDDVPGSLTQNGD